MPSSARSTVLTSSLAIAAAVAFAFVATRRPTLPTSSPTVANAFVGRDAPNFELPAVDGTLVNLADFRGKVVVLDFWTTWCPTCIVELPMNTAVAKRYADRGVAFLAVNAGEKPDRVKAFLADNGIDAPVLLDETTKTALAYDAQYLPLVVVIDANGRIVAHASLTPEEAEATLPKWIESALESGQAAGRGNERPATRP